MLDKLKVNNLNGGVKKNKDKNELIEEVKSKLPYQSYSDMVAKHKSCLGDPVTPGTSRDYDDNEFYLTFNKWKKKLDIFHPFADVDKEAAVTGEHPEDEPERRAYEHQVAEYEHQVADYEQETDGSFLITDIPAQLLVIPCEAGPPNKF